VGRARPRGVPAGRLRFRHQRARLPRHQPALAGQRVIATSAVRCVGNTLLLNGDVYSPPFKVSAIGPYGAMLRALNASPGVRLFQQAAAYYGLGYTAESESALQLPAYRGSISLEYAKAGGH
jgi:uncharacterized protein YlxW (UPF0749 family)